jgi:hypothetical protein
VDPAHTSVCRRDADGGQWEWSDAAWDSTARTFRVETGRLGQFALVRDDTPPEVTLRAAPTHVRAAAYPQWELTAQVADRVSGIDGRHSFLSVDEARVPTEWDPEARLLRWRPYRAPRPGRHPYRVEVVDQAGNRTVKHGAFVIASP